METRIFQKIGLSTTTVSGATVSKNDIFPQIDQTRKGPLADTRGNRVDGHAHRTSALSRSLRVDVPDWGALQKLAADKEVPRAGRNLCHAFQSSSRLLRSSGRIRHGSCRRRQGPRYD